MFIMIKYMSLKILFLVSIHIMQYYSTVFSTTNYFVHNRKRSISHYGKKYEFHLMFFLFFSYIQENWYRWIKAIHSTLDYYCWEDNWTDNVSKLPLNPSNQRYHLRLWYSNNQKSSCIAVVCYLSQIIRNHPII